MRLVNHNLTLGVDYLVDKGKRKFRIIRTSPKGFNLLNLENSKCIFKKAFYARRESSTKGTFEFIFPESFNIKPADEQV